MAGSNKKSYVNGDLVVCLLRGGFTRVDQTLREVFVLAQNPLVLD